MLKKEAAGWEGRAAEKNSWLPSLNASAPKYLQSFRMHTS
jgi:hypothetical protein